MAGISVCFGFNGSLRIFVYYRAVIQKEGLVPGGGGGGGDKKTKRIDRG